MPKKPKRPTPPRCRVSHWWIVPENASAIYQCGHIAHIGGYLQCERCGRIDLYRVGERLSAAALDCFDRKVAIELNQENLKRFDLYRACMPMLMRCESGIGRQPREMFGMGFSIHLPPVLRFHIDLMEPDEDMDFASVLAAYEDFYGLHYGGVLIRFLRRLLSAAPVFIQHLILVWRGRSRSERIREGLKRLREGA